MTKTLLSVLGFRSSAADTAGIGRPFQTLSQCCRWNCIMSNDGFRIQISVMHQSEKNLTTDRFKTWLKACKCRSDSIIQYSNSPAFVVRTLCRCRSSVRIRDSQTNFAATVCSFFQTNLKYTWTTENNKILLWRKKVHYLLRVTDVSRRWKRLQENGSTGGQRGASRSAEFSSKAKVQATCVPCAWTFKSRITENSITWNHLEIETD